MWPSSDKRESTVGHVLMDGLANSPLIHLEFRPRCDHSALWHSSISILNCSISVMAFIIVISNNYFVEFTVTDLSLQHNFPIEFRIEISMIQKLTRVFASGSLWATDRNDSVKRAMTFWKRRKRRRRRRGRRKTMAMNRQGCENHLVRISWNRIECLENAVTPQHRWHH